ncbi:hypothetical protein QYE76_004126 [Lolium multiflorum]|uniref:Retrotransposon gag domain-containing protein n=1 Tax=Lolium multiflorum TaxID=4521 RepID=A0AAD8RQ24_LOLMU|nr:hypothetical protein QYE76_004126 [Lolium multiflorum]
MAEEQITYEDLPADHKKKYDDLKAIIEAELIGSFEKTRSHGIRFKGFTPQGVLEGVDLSLPSQERTRALRQEINYVVAHCIGILRAWPPLPYAMAAPQQQGSPAYVVYKVGGHPGDYQFLYEPPKEIPHGYVCTFVPDCNNWTQAIQAPTGGMAGAGAIVPAGGTTAAAGSLGADAEKQAWLAKYATAPIHESSAATTSTADQISAVRQRRGETVSEYIQRFRTVKNRCYSVHLTEKEAVELAVAGLAASFKDLTFQVEYNSLAHMVQRLTLYEQRHPELYQDKFKRAITLVNADEDEDSAEDQEVAVAEWTRTPVPVSCKWVNPPGPPRGLDFDVSKTEQIFDLLLKEKQLKLPEGHKSLRHKR